MRLDDYIRAALLHQGARSISIRIDHEGVYQAAVQRASGNAFGVELHEDPVDALWNVLAPHTVRRARGAQSGPFIQVEGSSERPDEPPMVPKGVTLTTVRAVLDDPELGDLLS